MIRVCNSSQHYYFDIDIGFVWCLVQEDDRIFYLLLGVLHIYCSCDNVCFQLMITSFLESRLIHLSANFSLFLFIDYNDNSIFFLTL